MVVNLDTVQVSRANGSKWLTGAEAVAPEGFEESAPEPPSPLVSSPFPSPIATEVKERLQNYLNKLKLNSKVTCSNHWFRKNFHLEVYSNQE